MGSSYLTSFESSLQSHLCRSPCSLHSTDDLEKLSKQLQRESFQTILFCQNLTFISVLSQFIVLNICPVGGRWCRATMGPTKVELLQTPKNRHSHLSRRLQASALLSPGPTPTLVGNSAYQEASEVISEGSWRLCTPSLP